MTPREKYVKALTDLLEAQKEVQAEQSNPFNLSMPTHLGLSNETFITDAQLTQLGTIIGQSAADNQKFAKLWNIGSDAVIKAKALLLML